MQKNNIALIIDGSESYLSRKLSEIYSKWGFVYSDMTELTEWTNGAASVPTMFTKNFVHLNLSDKKDLKSFVELIDKRKSNKLFEDGWYGSGLIITTTHQQGSSKIIKLVNEFKGTVIEKRKIPEIKKELLNNIGLNPELTKFLEEFSGDDYEILLTISNSLSQLSKEEKSELTIEKLYAYIPSKPGSIPPWEFIDEVFKLNPEESFSKLERTLMNTHPLIPLSMLKNKIGLLYQYTVLNSLGIVNDNLKAEKLGLKNGYVFLSFKNIKRKPDLRTVEYLCKLIHKTEEDLKGNARIDGKQYLMNTISKIILALSSNSPIEKL